MTIEPAPPAPVKTKITGTAHVGFVKDCKSTPPNQKVKAVTASIPSLGPSEAEPRGHATLSTNEVELYNT